MIKIKIADFKSHLSNMLHRVRAGERLVVTDRNTPIAWVTPYTVPSERLTIVAARILPKLLKRIKILRSKGGTNSLPALLKDREDDLN